MARSVEIVPASYADAVYVARRMRQLDAEEIYPHLWNPTPENLAAASCQSKIKFVALLDDEPVVAFGGTERFPKVWLVWMFATDQWIKVALSVTKFVRRQMMVEINHYEPVRLDCWSMDGHDTAHQWLEAFGFIREATVEDYSSAGKTYHCYSITKTRLERKDVLFLGAENSPAPAHADGGDGAVSV